MATIIRYEINSPQRLALVDPAGKLVEGQYGNQYLHKTTDGRITYLDPSVQAQINQLDIQPGEEIEICRSEVSDGKRKVKQWTVRSINEGLQPEREVLRPTAPAAAMAKVQVASKPATSLPQDIAGPRVNQHAAADLMAKCLCSAIDALLFAQGYAAEHGLTLKFNEEDVRTVGNSLLISATRESEMRAKQGRAA